MKITFLITGFTDGGAQKQCLYLIEELSKIKGIEIQLLYFLDGVNSNSLNFVNVSMKKIETSSLYRFSNIVQVDGYLKKFRPNILFTWLHACDVYGFFLSIRHPRVKWVIAERDSSYPAELKYVLRRFLGKMANEVICNSAAGQQYWSKGFWKNKRTKLVSNIYKKPVNNKNYLLNGTPSILYVGRFEEQKNIITLVNALCKIAERNSDAHCYFIGDGSKRDEIIKIIISKKCEKHITVLPFQNDIGSFFENCNLFVNISHHEGAPNTVIEAAAAGKIIVASKIQEHIDLLGSQYNYYVNDFNVADEVAVVIQRALDNLLVEQDNSYFKKRLELMSADIVAKSYVNIFKEILKDDKIS